MLTDHSGDPLTRKELLRRIGRLEQVAGIEPLAFDDGPQEQRRDHDLLRGVRESEVVRDEQERAGDDAGIVAEQQATRGRHYVDQFLAATF